MHQDRLPNISQIDQAEQELCLRNVILMLHQTSLTSVLINEALFVKYVMSGCGCVCPCLYIIEEHLFCFMEDKPLQFSGTGVPVLTGHSHLLQKHPKSPQTL